MNTNTADKVKEDAYFNSVSEMLMEKADNEILQMKNKKEVKPIPEKTLERVKKYIYDYYDQYKKVPPKSYLSKKLHLSLGKTTEVMQWLSTVDFIEKVGTRYQLTETALVHIPSKTSQAINKIKKNPAILVIKIALFIIGSGAVYMSIFHSTDFLSEYYQSERAIVSAVIMIVFNVLAADMIVFFHLKSRTGLVWLFSILLILGTIFSMGSTIWGLRTTLAKTIKVESIEINEADTSLQNTQILYQNILDKKVQAKQNLESERVKRDGLVMAINSYTEDFIKENEVFYNKQNGRRYVADMRVDSAQEAFDKVLEEEQTYLENNTVVESVKKEVPDNAYTWISEKVFKGMNAETLQFWMSVYPALFYDIIAPVSFSIVFFLSANMKKKVVKKKKKRGKKK